MLFIFCVGVEAGPNFFSIFFRDGKNYRMLALVMVGSALVIALGLGKLFGWQIGLTAGMLAALRRRHRFWSVLAIHCVIPAWRKQAALTGTG
ncbi:hypothetical protein ACLK2I_04545 [Escherichia coli]